MAVTTYTRQMPARKSAYFSVPCGIAPEWHEWGFGDADAARLAGVCEADATLLLDEIAEVEDRRADCTVGDLIRVLGDHPRALATIMALVGASVLTLDLQALDEATIFEERAARLSVYTAALH